MKKDENIYKNTYTSINEIDSKTFKKSLTDKIRDLILKNEITIKRYEKLKQQTNNSQKKMDYMKIISKFRTRQIGLHNKLNGLNLIMNNPCLNNVQNKITKRKTQVENINNNNKKTFHKRINSSDYNYSALYTNNNILNNNKKNSKVNSTNDLNKLIPKPTKISNLIPGKKKEIKLNNNNNKNLQYCYMTPNYLRINTNTNDNCNNSTILKNRNNKNNNICIKTNNKKENDKILNNKKNIIIINNINNYYGKIENIYNNQKSSEHIINKYLKRKIKERIMNNNNNIIDEEDESYANLEYEDSLDIDEMIKEKEFKLNPNLVFKKRILKIKKNVVIEIFNAINKNNKVYVAISEKSLIGHNIKLFKFKNRKFITRLKRHKNRIISIKYFFNKLKMHDFLVSGDTGLIINIWDISYKFPMNQFLFSIKYEGAKIYNLLPLSIELKENNINNFLLVYDKTMKIYDLNNGNFLKNINNNRLIDERIINLIIWKNKNNNFDYIIKCTEYKIIIFNFIDTEIFFNLSDYSNNEDKIKYITEGCVTLGDKNKEYLCIFSYSSYLLNTHLEIWDLYELNLKEKIFINRNIINDTFLLNITPWNYKYILFSDGNKNYLYVIDLEINKIISKIAAKSWNDINHIYCKKINIKEFGESLIVWKHNNYMSLFAIN